MSALDFNAFFHAVHHVSPLPWQSRLARRLIENDTWPDLIDLPTASGKTACLDVALFHLAWCAERGEPWRAARRIVFMVDRRIIVDAAYERAEEIRIALEQSDTPAVKAVAEALRKLGGDAALVCQKLRGGMPRERGFALHPAQPMIITSTVDQIGSRLLFRGYGMSPYSWPLHAGLLGHDTLLLLDEAHLSSPFIQTISAVRREQARAEQPLPRISPLKLVPLSATAQTQGESFRLDERDLENELIAERRSAPKPARLLDGSGKPAERVKTLLRETERVYGSLDSAAPTVAVIVNRVRTARDLFEQLRQTHEADCVQIELMTGRSRPLDRDQIARRLLDRAGCGHNSQPGEAGLIVVATQSIEVGADLDFNGMVTECASLDALRQRFGRLDRLGRFRKAQAVIVGGGESEDDPVYGSALCKTWHWLNENSAAQGQERVIDFAIGVMERILPPGSADLITPPRKCLPLAPAYVQLLAQTSPRPMYDPSVGSLLHGLGSSDADVQIIWRSDLPMRKHGKQSVLDANEDELVDQILELMPPTSLETLAIPLSSVRAWLMGAKDNPLTDLEGASQQEDDTSAKGQPLRKVWRRKREKSKTANTPGRPTGARNRPAPRKQEWELANIRQLRPGDTIVVPPSFGGCDEYGFAPDSILPASDLSADARNELKRERVSLLTEASLAGLASPCGMNSEEIWAKLAAAFRDEQLTASELLAFLLDMLELPLSDLGWPERPVTDLLLRKDGTLYALVLRSGVAGEDDLSDEDISSSRSTRVLLDRHNKGVGQRARQLSVSVGFSERLCETLGRAGDTHDVGKADPRFQRLLRGSRVDSDGALIAKGLRSSSTYKVESSERHEAYSVAVLHAYPSLLDGIADPELAMYLVGSHHGRGRPWMPDRLDEGTAFTLEFEGATLSYDGTPRLGSLEAAWPTLFWRLVQRHGPWGLAYLEAVLRLADHLQSRDELAGAP